MIAELFRVAQEHSLIDKDRLIYLQMLALQAPAGGNYIEVGCWRGGSGLVIAHAANLKHPGVSVWLCDTFTGIPTVTAEDLVGDGNYRVGEHGDCSIGVVEQLLCECGAPADVVSGLFPESVMGLGLGSIAFAHLDVDVYQSARQSFDYIWERLVPGGLIVLDDYGYSRTPGIKRCVEESREKYKGEHVFIESPSCQAVFEKVKA